MVLGEPLTLLSGKLWSWTIRRRRRTCVEGERMGGKKGLSVEVIGKATWQSLKNLFNKNSVWDDILKTTLNALLLIHLRSDAW